MNTAVQLSPASSPGRPGRKVTICLCTATFFSLVTEGQDRRKCRIRWNTNPQIWEKRERTVLLLIQTGKGTLKGSLLFIPLYILEEVYKETKGARREERWRGTSFPATQPSDTGGYGHRRFEWPQRWNHGTKEILNWKFCETDREVKAEESHVWSSYINPMASAFGHCLERTPGMSMWSLMLCALQACSPRQTPLSDTQPAHHHMQCQHCRISALWHNHEDTPSL